MPRDDKHSNEMTERFRNFEGITECQICGERRMSVVFPPDVVRCDHCKTLFRNPRPTQEEIKRSYDSGQNYDHWKTQFAARQQMWERRIELIRKFVPNGKLLDVGVGDGHFLKVAKDAGFVTAGTELSEVGARLANERGHQVFLGQFEDYHSQETYDVVTIWHVLEHVPDPGAVLAHAFRLLRVGGILAVAVPNEANPLWKHRLKASKVNPLGEMVWGGEIHLTHFEPKSLQGAMRRTGFDLADFGVDDIYHPRSARSRVSLAGQTALCALTGWHCAVAMYAIGRKLKD